MAYQKFASNFTLNNQIVYEIITNQFTPIQVAAHLTSFCASNLSLKVITDAPLFHKSHFTVTFFCLKRHVC